MNTLPVSPPLSERLASTWLGAKRHPQRDNTAPSDLDRTFHAWLGQFTASTSPVALALAYSDWIMHLHMSPSKRQELLLDAWEKFFRWCEYCVVHGTKEPDAASNCVKPLPQDKRFVDPAWQRWP